MPSLISIVMCTYNGAEFLQQQIDSLLQQTYPSFEIIISDDNSTDGTKEILEKYQLDNRFRIFYQKDNLGPVENFSFVTLQAKGEYIAFSDQDDIWMPDKIEKLYLGIGEHWLSYSDSALVTQSGKPLHRKLSDLRNMSSGNDTRGFVFSNIVWGHAMLINRALVSYVLPSPGGVPHDIWFTVKAASLTGIVFINKPLTLYRQHDSTVTKSIAQKTTSRPMKKRLEDFELKLRWIAILRDNARPETKDFFRDLYNLYSQKAKRRFVWRLFFFLLKNQAVLFCFTKKSYMSRIAEIRKLARGESAGSLSG